MICLVWIMSVVVSLAPLLGWKDENWLERVQEGECMVISLCKCLLSPEIDSDESIPPACEVWQAGTINRVVVLARQSGNRFLKRFTNTGSGLGNIS
jgi:hypothetical protein